MAVGQNDAHPERSPIDGGEWRMEKTTCQVCMHHCSLAPGQIGLCGARKNEGGEIVCENYGQITSIALDPIEKKSLKNFRPVRGGAALLVLCRMLFFHCCPTHEQRAS